MTGVRRVLEPAARGLGWATATAVAYLLAIAGAAAGRRRTPPPQPRTGPRLRLLVLIPAHDEETTLPGTLAALQEVDYPSELVRVVVVADNCADATADVATATEPRSSSGVPGSAERDLRWRGHSSGSAKGGPTTMPSCSSTRTARHRRTS